MLRGYTRGADGLWHRLIRFNRAPERVILTRDSAGRLVRTEHILRRARVVECYTT